MLYVKFKYLRLFFSSYLKILIKYIYTQRC